MLKNKGYKIKFDRFSFTSRWGNRYFLRNSAWIVIGIAKDWASPNDFCYKICFFGFDLFIWFKRIFSTKK